VEAAEGGGGGGVYKRTKRGGTGLKRKTRRTVQTKRESQEPRLAHGIAPDHQENTLLSSRDIKAGGECPGGTGNSEEEPDEYLLGKKIGGVEGGNRVRGESGQAPCGWKGGWGKWEGAHDGDADRKKTQRIDGLKGSGEGQ